MVSIQKKRIYQKRIKKIVAMSKLIEEKRTLLSVKSVYARSTCVRNINKEKRAKVK